MGSLSRHLRDPEYHARLPFHPDCPICRRERLVGTLSSEALISRRAQAAIAAGVLALSAGAPPAAFAQEPDQTIEGGAAPDDPSGGDPAHSPDFDPGGETTDLPFDAPPTPQVQAPADPSNDDAEPLEPEPATDVDAPIADGGDEAGQPEPTPQPAPPAAAPAPTASPPTVPPEGPTATPAPSPTPEAPVATTDPPSTDSTDEPEPHRRGTAKPKQTKKRPNRSPEPSQAPVAPPAVPTGDPATPSPEASEEAAAPAAPVLVAARGTGDQVERDDRFHVVRPGESLWSIAGDRLGDQATIARTAREVNRLWELNRDRIGTGDPDLLMAGTRLTLR